MATKNGKRDCGWLNSNLKLTKEFTNESFERLVEYSNENELNLMRVWLNGDQAGVNRILMYGTAQLSYFEHFIEEDKRVWAAYKLGQLSGYLDCLNTITGENHQNDLAKSRFEKAKLRIKEANSNVKDEYLEEIIRKLSKATTSVTVRDKMFAEFPLDLSELNYSLLILSLCGLLGRNENLEYSLTDAGLRVAKQLAETN